jgi:hypothetical protein
MQMREELQGSDGGITKLMIRKGFNVGPRSGFNDGPDKGFVCVMETLEYTEAFGVLTDRFSYLGCSGCRGNERIGRWCNWGRKWDTGQSKVAPRGNGQCEVAMVAAAMVGVDGHGVGVEFTLELLERGMGGWMEVRCELGEDWDREVLGDGGDAGGGHGD